MAEGRVIKQFPEVLQTDLVRTDVNYEYDSDMSVYNIQKGPATRVFSVSSGSVTFTEGVDYDLIEDSDGNITKIDWGIGGSNPSDGDLFTIDQEYRSVMARYLESHDIEFDRFEQDIISIISAKQVDNASGEQLDRIGAIFGQLGKRSGRTDIDYRAYLKSIVDSFSGRGSRAGLKFAIAAAVGGSPDDIEIVEDTQNLSYTIIISNVDTEFLSSSINDLADLADPSGVDLDEAILVFDGRELAIDGSSTAVTQAETGLGGGTLTLDGNSTLG